MTTSTCAVAALFMGCWLAGPAVAADAPPAHHHDMAVMQQMAALDTLPGTSLYQIDLLLEPSSGPPMKLAQLKGVPLLVTMFYSQCTSVCPMLTSQLQRIVATLPPADRLRVRVLMVSFDTARDTPQALASFRTAHHILEDNWLVARASAHDVRTLAAALGIQYRELPDHSFSHSAVLTLLDAQGVPRARTQAIAGPDPAFMAAVMAQVRELEPSGPGAEPSSGATLPPTAPLSGSAQTPRSGNEEARRR